MDKNQPIDTAREPVDTTGDAEFMDTGILREDVETGAYEPCKDVACQLPHPHPPKEKEEKS